jgi:hypothetical protein
VCCLCVDGIFLRGGRGNSDYYIHLNLKSLFSELEEGEKTKETYLLSKNTIKFFRQKLPIIVVKIIYHEISSGIASMFKSQNSEIRNSSVKYNTLNCRMD